MDAFVYLGYQRQHNTIVCVINSETSLVINEDNELLLQKKILNTGDKVIFFNSYKEVRSAVEEEQFLDVDNDAFFIPSSCLLSDILQKKAEELKIKKIVEALIKDCPQENCDTSTLNVWLCKHNLMSHRFILLQNLKEQSVSSNTNTIIDFVYYNNIKYYVWVKNVANYVRPFNSICKTENLHFFTHKENWSFYKPDALTVECDYKLYTMEMLILKSKNNHIFEVGSILVYPCKIIVGNSSIDVIKNFLNYIEEELSYNSEIVISGYFVFFLEKIILSKYSNCLENWIVTQKSIIHILTGKIVYFFDGSIFFPRAYKKYEYVRHWTKHEIKYINFFNKRKHLKNYLEDTSKVIKRLHFLNLAINNHIQSTAKAFELETFDFSCSGLLDILLLLAYKNRKEKVYYPKHCSVISFIKKSIFPDTFTKKELCALPIITHQFYPEGIPYWSHTPNPDRLSICLCDVEVKDNTNCPFLYSQKDKYSKKFTGVFNSIDIETATALKGYKIKVKGCLEWKHKSRSLENIRYDSRFEEKELILSEALHSIYSTECVFANDAAKNNLHIISFIVSYYKRYARLSTN